ncbi:MAG TPA: lytic transglycosylase domain-containing protein [Burkholderiaceae bacterium]|nr:lytic transglycosylase domain-containing protein [Burkholderiaceae bacterium]
MAGSAALLHTWRNPVWIALVIAAASGSAPLHAEPCSGKLGEKSSDALERYSMISAQCASLASAPMTVHRAAQLDLYDKPVVAVTIAPGAASAPAISAPVPPLVAPPIDTAPPSRDQLRVMSLAPALLDAARENQVDPLLLHAIAHVESRHNPRAVSKAGARGVMQVMPATGKRFGVNNPEQGLFDASTNLRASAAYLRTLRTRYGDDLRLMLAAYNAGEGAVEKAGGTVPPYPETQAYVRDVLAVYRQLNVNFTVSESGQLIARGGKKS